jgi:hypothetical protein
MWGGRGGGVRLVKVKQTPPLPPHPRDVYVLLELLEVFFLEGRGSCQGAF